MRHIAAPITSSSASSASLWQLSGLANSLKAARVSRAIMLTLVGPAKQLDRMKAVWSRLSSLLLSTLQSKVPLPPSLPPSFPPSSRSCLPSLFLRIIRSRSSDQRGSWLLACFPRRRASERASRLLRCSLFLSLFFLRRPRPILLSPLPLPNPPDPALLTAWSLFAPKNDLVRSSVLRTSLFPRFPRGLRGSVNLRGGDIAL